MNEINVNGDDVISMKNSPVGQTFKGDQLKQYIKDNMGSTAHALLDAGMDCEYLSTQGGGWQRGKLQVILRFVSEPEEPGESAE